MEHLFPIELLWRDSYEWLLSCGYQLRPRLRPDWVPAWYCDRSKKELWKNAGEDTISEMFWAIDTIRLADGKVVVLKNVQTKKRGATGYEIEIASYISLSLLQNHPDNHCIAILKVLNHPDDDSHMPLLRPLDCPRFETVGEGVDFFLQAFKGLQFLHRHRIAHRSTRLAPLRGFD